MQTLGAPIEPGCRVKIQEIPIRLTHDLQAEDVARLKRYKGKTMTVDYIDPFGYVWFVEDSFCLRPDEVLRV